MLTRALRTGGLRVRSAPAQASRVCRPRWYNDNHRGGRHHEPLPTYFQESDQQHRHPEGNSRRGGWIAYFSVFALLSSGAMWVNVWTNEIVSERRLQTLIPVITLKILEDLARPAGPITYAEVEARMGAMLTPYHLRSTSMTHTCVVSSNCPVEDTECTDDWGSTCHPQDPSWQYWGVFDGHAGAQTSNALSTHFSAFLASRMGCLAKPYQPNDQEVVKRIKSIFLEFDKVLLDKAANLIKEECAERRHVVRGISSATAGSCALVALYNPATRVLRVANVGDSRAVLGRWDEASKTYVTQPMSVDQTGFNPDEVARIEREHPGEDVVDPKTGRVHGLAVSRAFGDARWKWPADLTQLAYESFWGPKPRPNNVIKTPPYLTAEPEVTEHRLAPLTTNPQNPDFLILATDGFWDHVSSEHAVQLVHDWLRCHRPAAQLAATLHVRELLSVMAESATTEPIKALKAISELTTKPTPPIHCAVPPSQPINPHHEGGMRHGAGSGKPLEWDVRPQDTCVEVSNVNCGAYLIKSAFGGNRKGLRESVLAVTPPHSRDVRDDATVSVIFFGDYADAIKAEEEKGKALRKRLAKPFGLPGEGSVEDTKQKGAVK